MDSSQEDLELPPLPAGRPLAAGGQSVIVPSSEFTIFPSSQVRLSDGGHSGDSSSHGGSEDGAGDDHAAEGNILDETFALWRHLRHSAAVRQRREPPVDARAYSMAAFVEAYVERYPGRLVNILMEPAIRAGLEARGLIIRSEDDATLRVDSSIVRRELRSLIKEPIFLNFEPYAHITEEANTIADVCILVRLLSQLLQNQFVARHDVDSIEADPEVRREVYMLSSILTRGYARNTAMFLRQVLGLYMLANGTSRRVLDTLSGLGIVASYQTLNRALTSMSVVAENNIKRVAHDPDGIIVYDNFNFMNRVRELAGGKQDQFVNLTTACLVACPTLKGPLLQRSLNLRQKFTHDMILKYLLPRRPSLDEASKYLLKFSLKDLFKLEDPPEYPAVDVVTYKESPYIQLGAIFENEGTIDGVYQVHEELWKRRLEFKDYDERLTLVYGDQKTTSFIRRIKQSQSEASDP
ncbi:hypothetical protein F4861DRAFT_542738 [Xylaria intraflava]|nr:hypothetical protein F4861DRAFT_542738 [Xylaria intraflava]